MKVISPLAPAIIPAIPPLAGVELSAKACGIRYKGRVDVALLSFAENSQIAGCFTRSKAPSVAVDLSRRHLQAGGGKVRAILVNSGNANAFTGKLGRVAAEACIQDTAKILGAKAPTIFMASTGVIGEPLPDAPIRKTLPALVKGLRPDHWRAAAEAIMTTDTFPKLASRQARIGDQLVTINGIAKGSGMIAPDMATMLAFLATDATLPAAVLQPLLQRATDRSFNCTTVDGDCSTSDSVYLAATGRGPKHPKITEAGDPKLREFRAQLDSLMIDLACQIVKDGEGAEKFITIDIAGAVSAKSAHRIGLSIANSPLVKTAIAGEDANWGRIVMAVGKAGEPADRDRLSIAIGGTVIAEKGERRRGYDEAPVVEHMKGRDIHLSVDLGLGKGKARIWTCDLTHRYIDINGSYRS